MEPSQHPGRLLFLLTLGVTFVACAKPAGGASIARLGRSPSQKLLSGLMPCNLARSLRDLRDKLQKEAGGPIRPVGGRTTSGAAHESGEPRRGPDDKNKFLAAALNHLQRFKQSMILEQARHDKIMMRREMERDQSGQDSEDSSEDLVLDNPNEDEHEIRAKTLAQYKAYVERRNEEWREEKLASIKRQTGQLLDLIFETEGDELVACLEEPDEDGRQFERQKKRAGNMLWKQKGQVAKYFSGILSDGLAYVFGRKAPPEPAEENPMKWLLQNMID